MRTTAEDLAFLRAAEAHLGGTLGDIVPIREYIEEAGIFRMFSVAIRELGLRGIHLIVQRPGVRPVRPGVAPAGQDSSGVPVDVWAFPADPGLPGLAMVVHSEAAAVLVSRIGIPGPVTSVDVVSYHPSERAVTRIRTSGSELFAKVVTPDRLPRLVAVYQQWHDDGLPVPAVLGSLPQGVLLLAAIEGTAGDERIQAGTLCAGMFDSAWAQMFEIPELPSGIPGGRTPGGGTPGAALGQLIPAMMARGLLSRADLDRAHTWIVACDRATAQLPPCAIHGDYHLGQLIYDDDRIVGVLDAEDTRMSVRAEDAGRFWAHLVATALATDGDIRARAIEQADAWRARWERAEPPFALSALGFAVTSLLSHAVGTGDGAYAARIADVARRTIPSMGRSSHQPGDSFRRREPSAGA